MTPSQWSKDEQEALEYADKCADAIEDFHDMGGDRQTVTLARSLRAAKAEVADLKEGMAHDVECIQEMILKSDDLRAQLAAAREILSKVRSFADNQAAQEGDYSGSANVVEYIDELSSLAPSQEAKP